MWGLSESNISNVEDWNIRVRAGHDKQCYNAMFTTHENSLSLLKNSG